MECAGLLGRGLWSEVKVHTRLHRRLTTRCSESCQLGELVLCARVRQYQAFNGYRIRVVTLPATEGDRREIQGRMTIGTLNFRCVPRSKMDPNGRRHVVDEEGPLPQGSESGGRDLLLTSCKSDAFYCRLCISDLC